MSKDKVRAYIHRKKSSTHSTEDQVIIAHHMWDSGELPSEDGITRREAEELWGTELEHSVEICLHHLEEIGIVESFRKPGPETYVIADWEDNGIINGSVDEVAQEGIEALIDDVQSKDPKPSDDTTAVADGSGMSLRQVVAHQFDLKAESLEAHLRIGDSVEKLNKAVDGIEEHDEFSTRDDYGSILFINAPYQYRLTGFAVDLYER